ncbi:RagB/SusD family nutrient uptake outer membrane protein [Flavobacterium sp. 3-210]
MKNSNYTKFFAALLLLGVFSSCNEDEFLKEDPIALYTAENVFSNSAGIEGVIANFYVKERYIYYIGASDVSYALLYATDSFFSSRGTGTNEKMGSLVTALVPSNYAPTFYYQENFKIIALANLLIDNVNKSSLTPEQKIPVIAEAKFFRGKAYRDMVYLYGGVPLVTEFSQTPVLDRVRATKTEILNQMALDFKDAADGMLPINKVKDGRVSNIVASFYLGETLISLGRHAEAVTEISKVVNDPNVALMKTRFGTRSTVFGKDVFWDLWQRGNQNRSSGNKEALWVAQFETDVPGGVIKSTDAGGANMFERNCNPAVWSITDPDGKPGFLGRRSDDNVGGNGVSFLQPTAYTTNTVNDVGGGLWPANYAGDIRCNDANLIKDAVYDNPASAYFGKKVSQFRGKNMGSGVGTPLQVANAGGWRFYKWFVKSTTPGDHPAGLYDPANPLLLGTGAAATYHDTYILRLPEAYLLRAEAYLALGNLSSAAADINVVRARAGATNVAPGNVSIDYILDERTREMVFEEQRQITLRRVGKYGERVVKYNWLTGPTYAPKYDLWPIPQKEIEANTGAVLAQNPGY